jgi:hypothetical protein
VIVLDKAKTRPAGAASRFIQSPKGATPCMVRALIDGVSKTRRSQMARTREKFNDPWYAKVAFGLFLCVLVGSLAALYSGVPLVQ